MAVPQLVHHFEAIEASIGARKVHPERSHRKRLSRSGRRLSLRTMFNSHARILSISSSMSSAGTASTVASPTTPTFSAHSPELLPMTSTDRLSDTTPSSDRLLVFPSLEATSKLFDPYEWREEMYSFPEPIATPRTASLMFTFKSESPTREIEKLGLDLFEPRPYASLRQGHVTQQNVIMHGIFEVMESG